MNDKILCVDDDPNILSGFRRGLRRRFDLDTAPGGPEGLEAVARGGPYAVIVSDMRMPGMDGVQFLAKVKEIAPNSVRMMLTGNADQKTAIHAVNEGSIFRFMTKPCSPTDFAQALEAGIEQYRLITAEKELIEKTLKGSIKMLGNVLALANPTAFGRASRVTRLTTRMARELKIPNAWHLEVAAMLSQLGCITLPTETLFKVYHGMSLTDQEASMFQDHPKIGSDLIGNIPRLERVAEIIAYQEKHFDGSGLPSGPPQGEEIPLGARVLKLLFDYDTLLALEHDRGNVIGELRSRKGVYDPALLKVFETVIGAQSHGQVRFVNVHELTPNMILDQDLETVAGVLLVAKGQEVTRSLCAQLNNFARLEKGVREPIRVTIPSDADANDARDSGETIPNEKAA